MDHCIRIFHSKEEALEAKAILLEVGVNSEIREDNTENLKHADFNPQPHFRVFIDKKDIKKAALFLDKKLREEVE